MLIIGAKGHALSVVNILEKNNFEDEIFFYDDISEDIPNKFLDKYLIVRSVDELKQLNIKRKKFILGIGNPHLRRIMAKKFRLLGWELSSVISNDLTVGNHNVSIGPGVNIMQKVLISNKVFIGEGSLINAGTMIHHNVSIGEYCEISPMVCITGNVQVGSESFIGVGANVIPKIKIGHNCIIGAGSVVIKDVPDNSVAVGVPAKVIRTLNNQ